MQRHRLPANQCRIRSSVGFGSVSKSTFVATIKPGVQKPHWRAAFSKNACWMGWSTAPLATPSIVVIFWFSTSTPRIRHELTILPFNITVHAPQLPSLQPSLDPVNWISSLRISRRLWRGSHKNSNFCPLMVVSTWDFVFTLILPSTIAPAQFCNDFHNELNSYSARLYDDFALNAWCKSIKSGEILILFKALRLFTKTSSHYLQRMRYLKHFQGCRLRYHAGIVIGRLDC